MSTEPSMPAFHETLLAPQTGEEAKRESWLREHAELFTDTDEITFLINQLDQVRDALRSVVTLLPSEAYEGFPTVSGPLLLAGKNAHTQANEAEDCDHALNLRTIAVRHEEAAVDLLNIRMDIQNLLDMDTPEDDDLQGQISDRDIQDRWHTLITDIANCQSETPSVSASGLLIRVDWFESLLIEPDFGFELSEDLVPVVKQSIEVIRGDLEQLTGKSTEAMMLIHKITHRESLQKSDWQVVESWRTPGAAEDERVGYTRRPESSANWYRRAASR